MTDSSLISVLSQGGKAAERGLAEVYQSYKSPVMKFLQNMGAEREESRDIFQDAVIALYENILNGKFRGESSLSSYLHGIARFSFLNRKKRSVLDIRVKEELEIPSITPDHLPQMVKEEQLHLLEGLFETLGKQCKETLTLSIFHHYDMKEIAERLSLSSEQIARNKKYRCLSRLRQLLEERGPLSTWLLK